MGWTVFGVDLTQNSRPDTRRRLSKRIAMFQCFIILKSFLFAKSATRIRPRMGPSNYV